MARNKKIKAKAPGLPPGSLVYTGEKQSEEVLITVFNYNEEHCEEKILTTIDQCASCGKHDSVTWINLDGVHNVAQIEQLGNIFFIHPLVLEDIVHTTQRPKVDDHEDYIFIVVKMLEFDKKTNNINAEQVSLILTANTVLSFQENRGDVLDSVRDRIRLSKGRMRKAGPDYLAYCLIDAIVDHYFVVLEALSEQLEELEDLVLTNSDPKLAATIHHLKRESLVLRKAVWPLREVVNTLERNESDLIQPSTVIFLRDLYDHALQVFEAADALRDLLTGLLETYLATVSNKMNEVMKVLTIISTIFIPLTFIVGVYGMNFDYMPELKMRLGYPAVMTLMAVLAIAMLLFFRRKKWV